MGSHVFSAGLVGFARGVNDTPKILGLLVGAAVMPAVPGALLITVVMALGGLVGARRVAETMALEITPIPRHRGLLANLTTSGLVVAASRFGLPVSTTHISAGSIMGIGGATGTLRWGATRQIIAAWIVTVPLAAVLGAALMWGLQR